MELLHENAVSLLKHIFCLLLKFIGDVNLKIVNGFNDLILNKRKDYNGLSIDKLKEKDIIKGKIISWNIHNGYDFYNRDKMIDDLYFLVEQRAEFYLLQEVFDDVIIRLLKETLAVKGFEYCLYENGNLLICNNDKFIPEIYKFDSWEGRNENNCIGINTKLNDKDIFLLNVHLQSDITMYQQYRQCYELIDFLKNKKNIIMLGDFNSISISPPIKILQDNFIQLRNNKKTFPSVCPLLTLDYGWVSREFMIDGGKKELEVINNGLSDHLSTTTDCSCLTI